MHVTNIKSGYEKVKRYALTILEDTSTMDKGLRELLEIKVPAKTGVMQIQIIL
jgi:hypothetical protein